MEQRVAQYIARSRLFKRREKILVAVSGGADSVALLRILLALKYECEVAHCNFCLRGEESDRDEVFVRQLATNLQLPLHVTHFDTRRIAKERGLSIEMTARMLRYQWFEQVRQECNASVVAVAHHQDDSVETLLLNLLRGTGINGLCGIRPKNGTIVRPLLCLNRQEIIDYLEKINQPYVTDSSNLETLYTRNKIRLELLPLMEKFNPSVRKTLLQTAAHLSDVALLYNQSVAQARTRVETADGIDLVALKREPAPETLLFELLHPLGFNASQTAAIFRAMEGEPGKVFLSHKWRVVKDRDQLLIHPLPQPNETTENKDSLNEEKPTLQIQELDYTPDFVIPREKNIACFDAAKLKHPLSLRLWKPGDSFIPFGMKGRKKVSDYLTNCKFSLLEKERQWVLCSGEEIIWLVGERPDNRFRVDAHTQRIIMVQLL